MGLGALKGRNCSGGAFRSQAAQRAGMSSAITTASASLWSSTYAQRPWGRPGRARGGGCPDGQQRAAGAAGSVWWAAGTREGQMPGRPGMHRGARIGSMDAKGAGLSTF